MANAPINFAAVGLQLGFTGTAGADTAAELRHLRASASQPGQQVFQLRELNLKLAFTGSCMAGEDVEDELRAVDDADFQSALKIALLRRRKLVVEDRQLAVSGCEGALQLLDLAATD